MISQKACLLFLFLCTVSTAVAQSKWRWPKDRKTAQSYHARYTDSYEAGNYKEAVEPLEWLIEDVPDLNKSIYQHGELIYTKLASTEEDTVARRYYENRALEMLTLREKYFGEPDVIYNRKGLLSYKFYRDRPEKLEEVYSTLLRSIALSGRRTYAPNLIATMDVARRLQKAGKVFPQDSIISLYTLITSMMSLKKADVAEDTKRSKRLDKFTEKAGKIFAHMVKIDCDLISQVLGPQALSDVRKETAVEDSSSIREHKLKTLLRLLRDHACDNSELELEVYRLLYTIKPSSELALVLARKFLSESNDHETAFRYYEETLKHSKDSRERASVYLDMAKVEAKRGKKISSRNYARKALQEDEELSDAYALIGGLYMRSYEECKKGVSRVEDRAIFLAAYNMFRKAGRPSMMSEAEAQFPTAEQIFELGLSEGTEITVGCWIQEKVLLVKNPN